ncbi:hypothetical protein NE237_023189 [Protea cynaroides]|uniref:t-SNARE coiled-coil homology domain-containing protein n=1 Tax=Protea cynaroides TaxID=273540 RepID=A0A9Q0HEL4_9MAGN|nr:hypothetical protein NE237_023189 [Protea cynaroides]
MLEGMLEGVCYKRTTNLAIKGALLGADPYRSRGGLSTRPVSSNSNEVQVQIDPMHADLDEEIYGLHRKVKQLKNVAQEIESEAKYHNDFISQLQMTLIKAQAGVKNNMRRLNMSIVQQGANNVLHVVLFALFIFFVVYLLAKIFRR